MDENVQFTVFRPQSVAPQVWYPLLAFAHLSQRRSAAPVSEPDPLQEVQRQACQALGEQMQCYRPLTQDSTEAVPIEGEITFLPEVSGIEFNPARATFRWVESVHRQDFRLRASPQFDATTARGRLTVFLGRRIIADVPLSINIDAHAQAPTTTAATVQENARPYRRVFASYSRKDLSVVEEFERYLAAFGDEYLRDSITLRAGELWNERLAELIREADIFQLFWSSNSMQSDFVRQEWEHALSLNRQHFVRPVYWEEPLPEDKVHGLPPEALSRLHFQRLVRQQSPKDRHEAPADSPAIAPHSAPTMIEAARARKPESSAARSTEDATKPEGETRPLPEKDHLRRTHFQRPELEEEPGGSPQNAGPKVPLREILEEDLLSREVRNCRPRAKRLGPLGLFVLIA
jgi:hypothetical protein